MLEVSEDGKEEWGRFGSLIDMVITYHHGYGLGKTLFCYYDVMLKSRATQYCCICWIFYSHSILPFTSTLDFVTTYINVKYHRTVGRSCDALVQFAKFRVDGSYMSCSADSVSDLGPRTSCYTACSAVPFLRLSSEPLREFLKFGHTSFLQHFFHY